MNTPVLPIVSNNVEQPITAKIKGEVDDGQFAKAMHDSKIAGKNTDSHKTDNKNVLAEQAQDKKHKHKAKLPDERNYPLETLALIIDTNALPINKHNNMARIAITEPQTDKETGLKRFNFDKIAVEVKDEFDSSARKSILADLPVTDKKAIILPGQDFKQTQQEKLQHQSNKHPIDIKSMVEDIQLPRSKTHVKTDTESIQGEQAKIIATLTSTNIENRTVEQISQIEPEITTNQFVSITETTSNTNNSLTRPINLTTHFNSPNWPQDFGRQIVNISQNSLNFGHTVQMQVNPPELGPVQITLHMSDGVTQATFVSPHASVRTAIENAIPNLQDQMDQAGISLGQTNVSDDQATQQGSGQNEHPRSNNLGNPDQIVGQNTAGTDTATNTHTRSRPDAIIDTFA